MKRLCHLIGDRWIAGEGAEFSALNPADGSATFAGRHGTAVEVDRAVSVAGDAFEVWADLSLAGRIRFIEAFGEAVKGHRDELVEAICQSTGKPRWESNTEVDAMIGKVGLTIQAFKERRSDTSRELPGNVIGAM